jgi:hypothetical protein
MRTEFSLVIKVKYFIPIIFLLSMNCKEEPNPAPTPTSPTPNPLVYHGNVILPDQNAVTKFAANHYEIIEGSLRLGVVYDEHQESGPSSSNIIDLSSLLGLRRITDALDITQTFSLKTLNGLDSLTYIGSLKYLVTT